MKITIVFEINGEPFPVEANVNEPLQAARNKALADSHNTGRPPDDWTIRTLDGTMLDPGAKISSFHFESGVRLRLSLGAGGGGSGATRSGSSARKI